MSKLFYRIGHKETQQGLWYDSKGNFTGLIHTEFNFCMNAKLQMPFDAEIVGWLSATDSLKDLFNWFSKDDIKKLENYGFYITVYEAKKVKQHGNHLVICQKTSRVKKHLSLAPFKLTKRARKASNNKSNGLNISYCWVDENKKLHNSYK